MSPELAEFGKYYKCYREGIFIGIALFVDDENIGPSFIKQSVDNEGRLINEVYIPESIEFENGTTRDN